MLVYLVFRLEHVSFLTISNKISTFFFNRLHPNKMANTNVNQNPEPVSNLPKLQTPLPSSSRTTTNIAELPAARTRTPWHYSAKNFRPLKSKTSSLQKPSFYSEVPCSVSPNLLDAAVNLYWIFWRSDCCGTRSSG